MEGSVSGRIPPDPWWSIFSGVSPEEGSHRARFPLALLTLEARLAAALLSPQGLAHHLGESLPTCFLQLCSCDQRPAGISNMPATPGGILLVDNNFRW